MKRATPSLSALGITFLGMCLRVYGLTRDGYWIDEASAVLVASHNYADIIKGLEVRLHPPLFYLVLHGWMDIAIAPFFVRLLSVLCGVLTIPLVYRLARELLGQQPAIAAALLLAISPAHIWYSQEARMYALLVLLCLLSFYLAWRWMADRWILYWFGYIVTSAAALYTQYLSVFALIAGTLGFAILLVAEGRYRDLRFWALGQLCVVLAFLPWLPIWAKQMSLDTPWIDRPSWPDIAQTWVYLGFGADWIESPWNYLRLSLLLAVIGLVILGNLRSSKTRLLLLPIAYSMVPSLLITAVSFFKPIYQDKQFLIVLPALMMTMGWALTRTPPPGLLLGLTLFAGLIAAPLVGNYTVREKQQWREASQYVKNQWEPGDVVYYNAGVASAGTAFYLGSSVDQVGYPVLWDIHKGGRYGSQTTAEDVTHQLDELARRYERLWLVQYYPSYWDPEGHILAWLGEYAHKKAIPEFHGVNLQLYVLDAD